MVITLDRMASLFSVRTTRPGNITRTVGKLAVYKREHLNGSLIETWNAGEKEESITPKDHAFVMLPGLNVLPPSDKKVASVDFENDESIYSSWYTGTAPLKLSRESGDKAITSYAEGVSGFNLFRFWRWRLLDKQAGDMQVINGIRAAQKSGAKEFTLIPHSASWISVVRILTGQCNALLDRYDIQKESIHLAPTAPFLTAEEALHYTKPLFGVLPWFNLFGIFKRLPLPTPLLPVQYQKYQIADHHNRNPIRRLGAWMNSLSAKYCIEQEPTPMLTKAGFKRPVEIIAIEDEGHNWFVKKHVETVWRDMIGLLKEKSWDKKFKDRSLIFLLPKDDHLFRYNKQLEAIKKYSKDA